MTHDSDKSSRQFKRWPVSIPCTVAWSGMEIAGTIDNLSYGGARIAGLSMVPPQGILILIRFQLGKEGSETTLTSKVVYATRSVFEGQAFHSLGVEFKRPARKTTTYLNPSFFEASPVRS